MVKDDPMQLTSSDDASEVRADTRTDRAPESGRMATSPGAGMMPRATSALTPSKFGAEMQFRPQCSGSPVRADGLPGRGQTSSGPSRQEKPVTPAPVQCEAAQADETPPSEHYAWLVKDVFAAFFLSNSMGTVSKVFDVRALELYRDNLLSDAGNPSDPIQIMMIEQLALAHLNIGRLHGEAATARDLNHAKAYGSLAIGLTGEFRRTALALKAYRTPDGARPASRGEEQLAVSVDREVSAAPPEKKSSTPNWEMDPGVRTRDPRSTDRDAEPASGGSRAIERSEAEGFQQVGSGSATSGRTHSPTLAILDWPSDARGEGAIRLERTRPAER